MSVRTRIQINPTESGADVLCQVSDQQEISTINQISRITFRLNGKIVGEILLGQYASPNPVAGIHIDEIAKGDEIFVEWQNIDGDRGQSSLVF